MGKKLARLVAVALAAAWLPAWALSLGPIHIQSRLNQPFSATIPIQASPGDEIDENVKVRVAGNEDYTQAGVDRIDFLSDLTFQVQPQQIVVSSRRIAQEPMIDLLVEVRWPKGKVLRQYTLLLDPAETGSAPPLPVEQVAPAPSARAQAPAERQSAPLPTNRATSAPADQSVPIEAYSHGNVGGTRRRLPSAQDYRTTVPSPAYPADVEMSRRVSPPPSGAPALPKSYGPITADETPWSVASKLRPDSSVSIEQVIIALFQWNPTAFGSSLNSFRPGSVLRVPDLDVIRRVDPQLAKSRIAEARSKVPAPKRPEPPPKGAGTTLEPAPGTDVPSIAPTPRHKVPEPTAAAPVEPAPAPAAKPAAPKAAEPPIPAPVPATPPATATTPPAEHAVEPAPSATPAPSAEQAPAQAPPTETSPSETPPPSAEPTPGKPAESTAPPEPDLSLPRVESALSQWLIPGAVIIGALLLFWLIWRLASRSRSSGDDFTAEDVATLAKAAPIKPVSSSPTAPRLPREPVAMEGGGMGAATAEAESQAFAAAEEPARVPAPATAAAKEIDVEGGDTLAEADFHLAYGLYDEAILLLTQALSKDPDRTDIRSKLAEAYFSANRTPEFLETARVLHDQVDAQGWEKIAVLGRQLAPHDPLFGGTGAELTIAPPPPPAKERMTPFDGGTPRGQASPTANLELKLEPFDLGSPASTPAAGSGDMLSDLDLDSSMNLDDSGMAGDETSTKLDLARAYIDLGDNEMARGLLGEVMQLGSGDQKQAAADLMRRLPA